MQNPNANYRPRSVRFRQDREAHWHELDRLTDIALAKGLKQLSAEELRRYPVLYRAALSSLAVMRKTAMDRRLIDYLEALSLRAYLVIYSDHHNAWRALTDYLGREFPKRVRGMLAEVGLSALLVGIGVLISFTLVGTDPGWYDAFVDPSLAGGRDPYASSEVLRSALYDGNDASGELPVFASWLFVHNAKIGLLCYALGFAYGLPTALLLLQNGLMLGAFLQLYHSRGMLFELGGWLLPHGIPEIGAVILCGAAGFHLARGIILPGNRGIRDSLKSAGRRSAVVVLGSVLLFAIAGVFEGVFRQILTNDALRYALAMVNGLAFFGFFAFVSRTDSAEPT